MNYINDNDYELIYLIKEDNEEALNILVEKYQPLIRKIASHYQKSYNHVKVEYEELIQEGNIGLIESIKSFKTDKEVLFFTFAFLCIKRKIYNFLKKTSTNKNIALLTSMSLEESIVKDSINYEEPLNLIEDEKFIDNIINFKNNLDFIDSNIFELRYNSFSYIEISQLLNINKKTVDNRLVKIKNKLKKYLLQIN